MKGGSAGGRSSRRWMVELPQRGLREEIEEKRHSLALFLTLSYSPPPMFVLCCEQAELE